MHTDVRLGLGWTASLIALGASIYAYKVPFQQSRDYLLAAVVIYVILSVILAGYVKYVEQDTIFEGRRKVFAGRVSNSLITAVYDLALMCYNNRLRPLSPLIRLKLKPYPSNHLANPTLRYTI